MLKLPTKPVLEKAIIHVLTTEKKEITTAEVNRKVADYLQIPEELLQLEGSQGTGTEFSYRMCWVRSSLKKEGMIENPTRGVWKIKGANISESEIQNNKNLDSILGNAFQYNKGDIVRLLPDYCTESESKLLYRVIESYETEKRAVISLIKKDYATSSVEYVDFDMIKKIDPEQKHSGD